MSQDKNIKELDLCGLSGGNMLTIGATIGRN